MPHDREEAPPLSASTASTSMISPTRRTKPKNDATEGRKNNDLPSWVTRQKPWMVAAMTIISALVIGNVWMTVNTMTGTATTQLRATSNITEGDGLVRLRGLHEDHLDRTNVSSSLPWLPRGRNEDREEDKTHQTTRTKTRNVHFIPPRDLTHKDAFSASWWQSTSRFLSVDGRNITHCEDAAFRMMHDRSQLRMTSDWLDFAVEHMSKWWKEMGAVDQGGDDVPYTVTVEAFGRYVDGVFLRHRRSLRGLTGDPGQEQRMIDAELPSRSLSTIAVIAFAPYRSKGSAPKAWGEALTVLSLGATMVSLMEAGFVGRVVVVGYNHPDDEKLVRTTFQFLSSIDNGDDEGERNATALSIALDSLGQNKSEMAFGAEEERRRRRMLVGGEEGSTVMRTVDKIGPMEVGYVRASDDEVKSKHVAVNMPRAAVVGLQRALRGELNRNSTVQWLGEGTESNPSNSIIVGNKANDSSNATAVSSPRPATHSPSPSLRWKYVYLTEPDTILQTRPGAIPKLIDALDGGNIVSPHRLQPIPHASDVPGMKETQLAVPDVGPFGNVTTVDAWNVEDDGGEVVCCDKNTHPGSYPATENCGNFWWLCGFSKRNSSGDPFQDHFRLARYQFMRLRRGTGIVSLVGSEHGRTCQPRRVSRHHDDQEDVCGPISEGVED